MAINKDFTFPEKQNGLYGTDDYTWDFKNHWPILTTSYVESETGVNLSDVKGTSELATIELKKVSKLSKLFLFKQLTKEGQALVEYRVAKDSELLYEAMEFQIQILESGFVDGGWLSMYETTDEYGIKSSIGMAAEDYLFTSSLRQFNVILSVIVDPEVDFRDGSY